MAGTSYTRQSTITDGNLITASLFNNEYNQLLNAFVYSSTGTTGHTHDGTAGQGGAIGKIGDQDFNNKIEISATNNRIECYIEVGGSPVEQLRIQDGAIVPVTDSDIDFGTTSLRFKDAFVDSLTVTGVVTATGFTIGSAVITEAELEILDGKTFLDEDDLSSDSATGIPSQQSVKAYVDAQVTAQDLDLTDGTTSISIDLDSEALSVLGGTGITSTASGNGVTLAIDSTVATLTGTQTLTNKTLTTPDVNTPDIDGGTIDGAIIGGTTAAAGSFTTVDATGNITVGGTVDGRDVAADGTKLDTVETNADVTDTTNVTAAGALMDSEVTNLAQVKAFDSADYATAAQGTTADAALPRTGGAMTGAITTNSTFDGRDVATDGSKLDGIEAGADVTDTANVTAAGALMDSELTAIASVKALNQGVATTDSPTFAALTSTGEITANGGIALGDNDKATFGASDDLQIYHDGSNSYISDQNTGNLVLQGSNLTMEAADGTNYIAADDGVSVYIYHPDATNQVKLSTTSTGIDVTGTATVDGLVVQQPSGANILLESTTSGATTGDIFGEIEFKTNDSSSAGVKGKIDSYSEGGVGNGALRLFTGNTTGLYERLRIDSSGNVGIGTSSPDAKVHSYQSAANYAAHFESANANSYGVWIEEGASANNGYPLLSVTDNGGSTQYFRVDSGTGNVGIGTSSLTGGNTILNLSRTGSGVGCNMQFANSHNGAFYVGLAGNTSGDAILHSADGTAGMAFGTGNTERMRIDSSGNVGIGVAPAFPFHVQASDGALAQFSNGVDADCTIRTASGVTLITPSTGTLALGTSSTERMRIDSSGNVQIGTGTPAYLVGTSDIAQLSVNRVGTSGAITNASRSAAFINVNGADGGSSIEFSTASANNTQPSERMRIDDAGNVGIGETNPKAPGGADARSLTLKGISYPQIITVATGATANSTTWRSISRSTNVYQIQTVNDAVSDEQTAYEISRGSGLLSISYQRWYAGTTEAMRIDSSGNFMVGTTSFSNPAVGFTVAAGGETKIEINHVNGTGSGVAYATFRYNQSTVGSITQHGTSATLYNTSSDQRLKENIADADDAGSKIDAIQVRKYDWKADGSHQDYGMIAQELQAVAPEAVSGDADSEEMMGVDYSKLVPMLIKEIQSLRNRVAQLEE